MKMRFRLITLLAAVLLISLGGALYLRFVVHPEKRAAAEAYRRLSSRLTKDGPPLEFSTMKVDIQKLAENDYGPAYLARLDEQSPHVAFDPRTRTVYYIYLRPSTSGGPRYGLDTRSWDPSRKSAYGASTGHPRQTTLHEVKMEGDVAVVEFSVHDPFPEWGLESGARYEARFPSGNVHLHFTALRENARKK